MTMSPTEKLLRELYGVTCRNSRPCPSLVARIQEHLDALEQGRKVPASDGTVTIRMKVHPDARINL
jgi:hypothetical protein